MLLTLNIYKDESLTELKRVAEAEKLKIPYRVAMYLIESLDNVDLDNNNDVLKFISGNVGKMDKIIKATFGVSELELDAIDAGELLSVLKELYVWVIDQIHKLRNGNDSKNMVAPVKQSL